MPVWELHYDIYHLGVYLVVAVMWLLFCLFVAFNAHLVFPRRLIWARWAAPVMASVTGFGLLLLDVLVFYGGGTMLLVLLLSGLGVPALAMWGLRRHLRAGS